MIDINERVIVINEKNECYQELGIVVEIVSETIFVRMEKDKVVLPFEVNELRSVNDKVNY
ncbi:MAG TPA: hypothetical protein GXX18_06065 [Bacillales bacterium]|nr:hypothetical protein [Bacillales bacterium]